MSAGREAATVFDRRVTGTYDDSRPLVFDKLKQLFGGGGDGRKGRTRPAGAKMSATARRPARPRQPRAGRTGDNPGGIPSLTGGAPENTGGLRSAAPTPSDIPCPNCGEPMLAGWGTTCGRCRPNLVAPKTLFMDQGTAAAVSKAISSMTLGWLVVAAAGDAARRGTLIELKFDDTILSRADALPSTDERVVEFPDVFMSSGHAVLQRPRTGNREDAFTIRDRDNPGPSANGTFVNSRRLAPGEVVQLADGDMIQVGSTELLFRSLWLPALSGVRKS